MKKTLILTTLILSHTYLASCFAAEIPFSVFHTNDLHSHFDGIKTPSGNEYEVRGGIIRDRKTH